MNRAVMWPLARRLRRAGHEVVLVGHATVTGHLDETAARVAKAIERHPGRSAVLIGHSLGGLTVARTAQLFPELPITDLILLGSPFQGSASSDNLRRWPFGRHLVGLAIGEWQALRDRAIPERVRVRTIAGTHAVGMGTLFAHFAEPNDGTVSVAETVVPQASERVVLHVSHTGMLFSAQVAGQLVAWLG